jgi:hypothetical protein
MSIEIRGALPMGDTAALSATLAVLPIMTAMERVLDEKLEVEEFCDFNPHARSLRLVDLLASAGVDALNSYSRDDIAADAKDFFSATGAVGARRRRLGAAYAEALKTMPYRDYLQTFEWQEVRGVALALAEGRCQVCNREQKPLDVHHRTYERRGMERRSDVTVLCRRCHSTHHAGGFGSETASSRARQRVF